MGSLRKEETLGVVFQRCFVLFTGFRNAWMVLEITDERGAVFGIVIVCTMGAVLLAIAVCMESFIELNIRRYPNSVHRYCSNIRHGSLGMPFARCRLSVEAKPPLSTDIYVSMNCIYCSVTSIVTLGSGLHIRCDQAFIDGRCADHVVDKLRRQSQTKPVICQNPTESKCLETLIKRQRLENAIKCVPQSRSPEASLHRSSRYQPYLYPPWPIGDLSSIDLPGVGTTHADKVVEMVIARISAIMQKGG